MKINFLIADEIRPEMGGKQTVLGLYADGIIMLGTPPQLDTSAPEAPEGIERLAFLMNISDVPEGKHKYKGQIIDPSGNPHGPEISFGEEETPKGKSRTIVVETKPFLIKGKGTYHFNLYFDDVLYSFPFGLIEAVQEKPSAS